MDFVIDLNKKLLDVYNSYIIIRNYAENLNMKDSNIYKLSNNFVENFDLLQREILSINRKEENNNAKKYFDLFNETDFAYDIVNIDFYMPYIEKLKALSGD